jgi:GMP synthase-like glutamine amidotransferase
VRALVIQQDPSEQAGLVGRALRRRGFELVPWTVQEDAGRPDGRTDYPDPVAFDLVLPLGSPWSVYDDAVAHWVDPQLDMLRTATEVGVPVLGICFGSQAIAAALGGTVRRGDRSEVGWQQVESPIPVLAGSWFQWHHDVFTLPTTAEGLARSPVGPQAFRAGRSLALQFHPEVDADHLCMWMDSGGRAVVEREGVDVDRLLDETAARQAEMTGRVDALVEWFLAEVAEV